MVKEKENTKSPKKLEDLKKSILELKNSFGKKRDEKEDKYALAISFSEEIKKEYDKIKKVEEEHNLKDLNDRLEKITEEKDELEKQILDIKKQIPRLTKTEKNLLNKIKKIEDLVKENKDESKLSDLNNDLEKARLEFKEEKDKRVLTEEDEKTKENYFNVRRKIFELTKESQLIYRQIRIASKSKKKIFKVIDDLKKKKEEAFDEFKNFKNEYNLISKKLKQLFKEEENLAKEFGIELGITKKRKENKDKIKEIENKLLKEGGVLTTEDLIAFQSK